jgi:hypothetical protein
MPCILGTYDRVLRTPSKSPSNGADRKDAGIGDKLCDPSGWWLVADTYKLQGS